MGRHPIHKLILVKERAGHSTDDGVTPVLGPQHHWLMALKQPTLVSTHNIIGSCPEITHTCLNMINTQHHWLMPLKQHTLVSTWPTQAGLGKRVGHSTDSGVTPALVGPQHHWLVPLNSETTHTCLNMINTQHHWLMPSETTHLSQHDQHSTSLTCAPETTHTCLNTHHWLISLKQHICLKIINTHITSSCPWNNTHLSQHDQHTTSLAHAPETTHTCLNMINTQHHWLRPLKQHTLVSTWPTHNITGSCSWNNTHLSQHDQHTTSLAHAPETTHTCLNMTNTQHHWLMPWIWNNPHLSQHDQHTTSLAPETTHTCFNMINTQHHWLMPLKQHTLVSTWSTHITGSWPWNNTTSLAHAPETTHTCLNVINTQHH